MPSVSANRMPAPSAEARTTGRPVASWFTGVWACTTQGTSSRAARTASAMSSSGSGARRREAVMTYPRRAGAKNRGGGGVNICARLPWTAASDATCRATLERVVPSATVPGAWTGLFRFKETTPIWHLRMVRRGMSLSTYAGSTFSTALSATGRRRGRSGSVTRS